MMLVSADILAAAEADLEEIRKLSLASGLARWARADYRRQLELARADLRILRIGDDRPPRLIAFYLAHLMPPEMELLQFAVHQDHRRQGWGGRLLDFLLKHGRQRGCGSCELEVRAANRRAIRFYQRNGFETVRVRRGYYRDPGDDALLMRRGLE